MELADNLPFPDSASEDLKCAIRTLLTPDYFDRQSNVQQIKKNAFFKDIDFDTIRHGTIEAPINLVFE